MCGITPNERQGGAPDGDSADGGGGAATMATLVYEQLHRLAEAYFRQQPPGHTLQPTALVHEAWLKLASESHHRWQDRTHFLAVAAKAMRQILVDHARGRGRVKRGGQRQRITLDETLTPAPQQEVDVLALDEALQRLRQLDERKAQVIEMRFFGGLTEKQAAEVLGVAEITVNRDWRMARAWIEQELAAGGT
ncbi:MAG: ECF-type sigma factor [Planctomycetota bacterium]